MISRFFIERPIFASVISIVIVIAGLISVGALPVAQFPEITPPTVEVKATYPGANAQVVAETVAAPIEQEVIGVENMIYMSSVSGVISGNWATGNAATEIRPAITITIEITLAKIGRSMKKREIIKIFYAYYCLTSDSVVSITVLSGIDSCSLFLVEIFSDVISIFSALTLLPLRTR